MNSSSLLIEIAKRSASSIVVGLVSHFAGLRFADWLKQKRIAALLESALFRALLELKDSNFIISGTGAIDESFLLHEEVKGVVRRLT